MQRHVYVKLEVTPVSGRESWIAELRGFLAHLPDLRRLEVVLPADEASAKAWDVGFVIGFDSMAELQLAQETAEFLRFDTALGASEVAVFKTWNFRSE